MVLLNILQNSDGTLAWDNLLVLVLAVSAGYFIHRFGTKKIENKKYQKTLAEWQSRYKRVENEYKNYKSSIISSEKHNEKAVIDLNNRIKGLEGDIRALSDEKNKFHHQLNDKEQEARSFSKKVSDLEERIKSMVEIKAKSDSNWEAKLQASNDERMKAMVWERKVRAAEEEAQKAKAAVSQAERKKLDAELRLRTTAEYAGKLIPLEAELTMTKAQLELINQNNRTLQEELEAKNLAQESMVAEIESLKSNLKKFFDADSNRSATAGYL
jgi:chromosome segregation ATPase